MALEVQQLYMKVHGGWERGRAKQQSTRMWTDLWEIADHGSCRTFWLGHGCVSSGVVVEPALGLDLELEVQLEALLLLVLCRQVLVIVVQEWVLLKETPSEET
jgi:hypothetical protein